MSLKLFLAAGIRSLGFTIGSGVLLLACSYKVIAAPDTTYDDSPNQEHPTNTRSQPPVVVDTEPVPNQPTPPVTTPPTTPTSSSGSTFPASESQARFSCELYNGQYTVMYHPKSQPGESYPWAIPAAMGGGWDSQRRCDAISQRLESYRPDGLLDLRTSVENGYNTICVTTQRNSDCRIVLTVPPGQDPISTRDRVFQNLTLADSGQATQGVNTLAGSAPSGTVGSLYDLGRSIFGNQNHASAPSSINLRPFLDTADGGTGTKLQGGVANQSNPRLNPNNFR